MRWRERDGLRWLEAELPGTRVAFTTRLGGVSEGEFASLNLGPLSDDEPGAPSRNRARLAAALGLEPSGIACGLQVHGAELAEVGEGAFTLAEWDTDAEAAPRVDGQVLAPGRRAAALVFVADCLPVALAGPGGVALLHCGWRGLAAGIVARGAEAVEARAAAIGPGIGPCCYEVGAEVAASFAALGAGEAIGAAGEAVRLDLAAAARLLLAQRDVDTVEAAELCTSCNPELFFSHRRDRGRTGRQAAVAWTE